MFLGMRGKQHGLLQRSSIRRAAWHSPGPLCLIQVLAERSWFIAMPSGDVRNTRGTTSESMKDIVVYL
ncbi:hypothetical protein QCA50_007601 [Cerrena zonata]|uniref:Uncharacterized protein n=1 Tax=Cerrena zonata TaxID=2478898 RepID=A0AAW0GCN3_9APHY